MNYRYSIAIYILLQSISLLPMRVGNIPRRLFSSQASNTIKTIYSLKEAQPVLQNLDSKALVAFDVDETLIISQDVIRRKNPEKLIDAFKKEHFEDNVKNEAVRQYYENIQWAASKQQLIEPESKKIIEDLQRKGIRVIALTHMRVGATPVLYQWEKWRYQQLYDLGIDLQRLNPMNTTLPELPRSKEGYYPTFYKGVLATARSCTKGQALAAYVKAFKLQPSEVVFFDDYEEHCSSVLESLKKLSIACTVFHYRNTEKIESKLDLSVAKFQYAYLLKHSRWLSDDQAKKLMQP